MQSKEQYVSQDTKVQRKNRWGKEHLEVKRDKRQREGAR